MNCRMLLAVLICSIFLTNCTTKVTDLKKPTESRQIVLDKDYLKIDTKANSEQAYVGGLLAGTYKLIGSNAKGDYYFNSSPSVLNLMNLDALEFIKTHKINAAAYQRNQYPRAVSGGGILISNKNGKRVLMIVHLLDPVTGGLGPTVGLINNSIRGGIESWNYSIEENLLKEISNQLN